MAKVSPVDVTGSDLNRRFEILLTDLEYEALERTCRPLDGRHLGKNVHVAEELERVLDEDLSDRIPGDGA